MNRRVFSFQWKWRCIAVLSSLWLCQTAQAKYIGGLPPVPGGGPGVPGGGPPIVIPWGWPLPFAWGPPQIAAGGYPPMWLDSDTSNFLSLSEGNVNDTVPI